MITTLTRCIKLVASFSHVLIYLFLRIVFNHSSCCALAPTMPVTFEQCRECVLGDGAWSFLPEKDQKILRVRWETRQFIFFSFFRLTSFFFGSVGRIDKSFWRSDHGTTMRSIGVGEFKVALYLHQQFSEHICESH